MVNVDDSHPRGPGSKPDDDKEKNFPGDHGVANIWGNHMHGLILTTISEKPYLTLLLARDRGGFELAIQTS